MKDAKSKGRWLAALTILLSCLGIAGQASTQDKQPTPLWLMDGCRAALRNPALAAGSYAGGDPAQVTAATQSQACVSSVRSLLTLGTTSGEFCPPIGTTAMEAVAVVVPFVDAHPATEPDQVRARVNEAMAARWPCH